MVFIAGCSNKGKYSYTLKDFREPLRNNLQQIINAGILTFDTAYYFIKENASMRELIKISNSEHPILRITGLLIIMDKQEKEGDFDLIIPRLDDSAIVTFDDGEFGYNQRKIADELLFRGKWKTEEQLNKTISEAITRYNNMRSVYYVLHKIKPEIKYYPYIKEMALRERPFDEIERALYRLASYKMPGDIKLIKEILFNNCWQISSTSFNLMEEFPDTTYVEVLSEFSRHNYKSRLRGTGGNSDFYDDFFKTVAFYKNDSSVLILKRIIKDIDNPRYIVDKKSLGFELLDAIKKYPSPLYKNIPKELVLKSKIDTSYVDQVFEVIPFKPNSKKPKMYYW